MEDSRRTFFEELLTAGGLAALLANQGNAQTDSRLAAGEVQSHEYWDSFYSSAKSGKGLIQHRAPAETNVRFLYYDDTKKALKFADQIDKAELLDHCGDVTVEVVPGEFRPGTEDDRTVKEYQSSQLRVDCVQTSSFLNILAPSAWVAMAVRQSGSTSGGGGAETTTKSTAKKKPTAAAPTEQ